mmetsp:Transcript_31639/g.82870  ORF Transcript_31639/g.82870 Transcript_31639/m.82870 type:complete len:224 (+) Transcript_31639:419-1090(+)
MSASLILYTLCLTTPFSTITSPPRDIPTGVFFTRDVVFARVCRQARSVVALPFRLRSLLGAISPAAPFSLTTSSASTSSARSRSSAATAAAMAASRLAFTLSASESLSARSFSRREASVAAVAVFDSTANIPSTCDRTSLPISMSPKRWVASLESSAASSVRATGEGCPGSLNSHSRVSLASLMVNAPAATICAISIPPPPAATAELTSATAILCRVWCPWRV